MKKTLTLFYFFTIGCFLPHAYAAKTETPTIEIVAIEPAPAEIGAGLQGTAIYRVRNTLPFTLYGVHITDLPPGVEQTNAGANGNCAELFNLAAKEYCNLHLTLTSNNFVYNPKTHSYQAIGGPGACDEHNSCSLPVDKQVYSTRISDPGDLAVLSIEPNIARLSQGETRTFTISSANTTANQVTVNIPTTLSQQLDSYQLYNCESIPASGSCTLTLIVSADATPVPLTAISVSAANASPVYFYVDIDEPALTVDSIIFTTPSPQSLVLTNTSDFNLIINQVEKTSSQPVGVTLLNPSNCGTIAANSSCSINVEAVPAAYGAGQVSITYTIENGNAYLTTLTSIVVAPVQPLINNGEAIVLPINTANTNIPVKNNSAFVWQDIEMLFNPIPGVTVDASACNVPDDLNPNASCDVIFDTSAITTPPISPDAGILIAEGTNIVQPAQEDVNIGISITKSSSSSCQYLQYQQVVIANALDSGVTIKPAQVIISGALTGKVQISSAPTPTTCPSDNPCVLNSTELAPGDSCQIWFKSLENTTMPLGNTEGTIYIGVEDVNNPQIWEKTFTTTFNNSLYVTGNFDLVGVGSSSLVPANNIARWDGTTWSALQTGLCCGFNTTGLWGIGRTLGVFNGNLYAGGSFTAAGNVPVNSIAQWNGLSWSDPGAGVPSSTIVESISTSPTQLYIAGNFTTLSSATNASRIAQWNGSTWSALGANANSGANNSIFALNYNNNILYSGGLFTRAGSPNTTLIVRRAAQWNATNSTWSFLGASNAGPTSSQVNTMVSDNTYLYMGGGFTNVNNGSANLSPAAARVARWTKDTTAWAPVGDSIGNGSVNTLFFFDNTLYTGGTFTQSGSTTVMRYIARLNGASWEAVGGSFPATYTNGGVFGLASQNTDLYMGGTLGGAFYNLAVWNGLTLTTVSGGGATLSTSAANARVRALLTTHSFFIQP